MTTSIFHTPVGGIVLFIFGAVVGSFLNVCIHRMPRAESIIFPPSYCPACRTRLRFSDLIPVFSLIFLRGRCGYCRQPVSWRYSIVEAVTGLLFILVGQRSQTALDMFANLLLISCLVAVFCIDLEHFIIPDELSLTPAAAGLLVDFTRLTFLQGAPAHLFIPWHGQTLQVPVPGSVLGLVLASGALLLVGWIGTRVFRKESMGGGDVKLAGAFGAYLGFQWHLLTFFLLSIIIGATVGIILMTLRKKTGKDLIPFGPMLVVGGIVTLLWGDLVTPYVVSIYSIR